MNKGFTLVELLVTIAIIGVLATVTMANFTGAQTRARDAQRKSDLKVVREALEQHKLDKGTYPTAGGLQYVANTTTTFNTANGNTQFTNIMTNSTYGLVTNGYMQKALTDPRSATGTTMQYRYAATTSAGDAYFLEACLENVGDAAGYASGSRLAPCNTGNLTNYRVTNP